MFFLVLGAIALLTDSPIFAMFLFFLYIINIDGSSNESIKEKEEDNF